MKATLVRTNREHGKSESSDSAAFWDSCVEKIRRSTGMSVADIESSLTAGHTLQTAGYLYRVATAETVKYRNSRTVFPTDH